MRRNKTLYLIWVKFCVIVDILCIITCTKFGDAWLRGLKVAGVKFFFPVDLDRCLYNTLARVCVMYWLFCDTCGLCQHIVFFSAD